MNYLFIQNLVQIRFLHVLVSVKTCNVSAFIVIVCLFTKNDCFNTGVSYTCDKCRIQLNFCKLFSPNLTRHVKAPIRNFKGGWRKTLSVCRVFETGNGFLGVTSTKYQKIRNYVSFVPNIAKKGRFLTDYITSYTYRGMSHQVVHHNFFNFGSCFL